MDISWWKWWWWYDGPVNQHTTLQKQRTDLQQVGEPGVGRLLQDGQQGSGQHLPKVEDPVTGERGQREIDGEVVPVGLGWSVMVRG